MESYDKLKEKKIDVSRLLEWHFSTICRSIQRRITFKQKYKNPWTVEVLEHIHREIFIASFKAIRDYVTEFGRTYNVKRDRRGNGTSYKIAFTHLGTLKQHLHKLSGLSKSEITTLFKKKTDKATACVVVSDEKPCVLEYNCRNCTLKVRLSYKVENQYGTVCSFEYASQKREQKKLVEKQRFLGIFQKNKKTLSGMEEKIREQEIVLSQQQEVILANQTAITDLNTKVDNQRRQLAHKRSKWKALQVESFVEETSKSFHITNLTAKKRLAVPTSSDLNHKAKIVRRNETMKACNGSSQWFIYHIVRTSNCRHVGHISKQMQGNGPVL